MSMNKNVLHILEYDHVKILDLEVSASMVSVVTFLLLIFFLFSRSKACDANTAIVANFGYFLEKSLMLCPTVL